MKTSVDKDELVVENYDSVAYPTSEQEIIVNFSIRNLKQDQVPTKKADYRKSAGFALLGGLSFAIANTI
jgi:hypothetical protein